MKTYRRRDNHGSPFPNHSISQIQQSNRNKNTLATMKTSAISVIFTIFISLNAVVGVDGMRRRRTKATVSDNCDPRAGKFRGVKFCAVKLEMRKYFGKSSCRHQHVQGHKNKLSCTSNGRNRLTSAKFLFRTDRSDPNDVFNDPLTLKVCKNHSPGSCESWKLQGASLQRIRQIVTQALYHTTPPRPTRPPTTRSRGELGRDYSWAMAEMMLVFDGNCDFDNGGRTRLYCDNQYNNNNFLKSATLDGEKSIIGIIEPTVLKVSTGRSGTTPYYFRQNHNVDTVLRKAFPSYGPYNHWYQSRLSELLSKFGSDCSLEVRGDETTTSCFPPSGRGLILVGVGPGPTPVSITVCWSRRDCEDPVNLNISGGNREKGENIISDVIAGSP